MNIGKGLRPIIVIVFFLLLIPVTFYIKIPYTINTNGVLLPVMEWRLEKSFDGTIVNTLKDNRTNTIPKFSATEFQRGDHVEFRKFPEINQRGKITAGDTIGKIHSHLEYFKLLELKGNLEEQMRMKQITLTGETPERIAAAYQQMILAQTEYETEKKLWERTQSLYEENVIALQEYELAQNSYNIKKQQINIARANYEVLTSGAKREEVERVEAVIGAINEQIENVNQRLDAFFITSPISGTVSSGIRNTTSNETLMRVIQNQQMVLLMPVEVYNLDYVTDGMAVIIDNIGNSISGNIIHIDDNIEHINQRQAVFVTAIFENPDGELRPNLKVNARIDYGNISLAQYLIRMSKNIYHN
ncbi:HlyD family secretion protein [Natronoflexus pectinivorans]|uniref:Multidrug resistance protein MdtA-like beta-barrel domain-containing protein n=1 Tax=Natronoflexus pectinivorans TaxID=682526 RepID=A0A4R2GCD1_9BACT|nr:hypothetical protein [Natronoflexus pectinivorans]TCO05402.1 hypothetical protein EV194_11634 [Natronoflexus pectinivorans]